MKRRVRQVAALARTKTARSSLFVYSASIASAGLAFVIAYFASRLLGPEDYGRLATSNAIVVIMVGVTDFGVSTALVRFTSERVGDKRHVAPFFQGALRLELAVALLIVLASFFTPQIAGFLGGRALELPVRIGFISSLFMSLGAYASAVLQSYQRFKVLAVLNVSMAAARTAMFLSLVAAGAVSLPNALYVNLAVAALSLVVGLAVIPRTGVHSSWLEQRQALKQMFHFGKWLVVSYSLNAVLSRIDILLLSHFRPASDVGRYAAALQLSSFMPLLLSALTTVLIPKVTSLPDDEEDAYLKKALVGAAGLALVLVPFVLLAGPLIHFVFGDKYTGAVVPFQLIMTSLLLTLFINPPSLLFYKWNRPKVLTYMNVFTGATMVMLMVGLTAAFGPVGTAAALCGNTVVAGFAFYWLLGRERRRRAVAA